MLQLSNPENCYGFFFPIHEDKIHAYVIQLILSQCYSVSEWNDLTFIKLLSSYVFRLINRKKVFRNRVKCWIRILIESYHSFASKLRKIRRYLGAGGGYVFNIDRALPGPQCLFVERGEGSDGDLFPTGVQDTVSRDWAL